MASKKILERLVEAFKAAKVEGRQGRGWTRLGWLDVVKRALAVRVIGLQEPTQFARERIVWREIVRA